MFRIMRLLFGILFSLAAFEMAYADLVSLFDGKTLNGWKGNQTFWKVENGAITGESTAANPCKKTTYLVYTKKQVANFELIVSFRFLTKEGNSGIQYRSQIVPNTFQIQGYQADLETGNNYSGILYDQGRRGIVARRGQSMTIAANGKKSIKSLPSGELAQKSIKHGQWNEYKIVADGNTLSHYINGHKTVQVIDNDRKHSRGKGYIALQLHQGPAMKVQFKNIRLLELDHKEALPTPQWIWSSTLRNNQEVAFSKTLNIDQDPSHLELTYTCDNAASLYINGKLVSKNTDWQKPIVLKVGKYLVKGENKIRVVATNHDGPAGLLLQMGKWVKSDTSWIATVKGGKREKAVRVGMHGDAPWGQVFHKAEHANSEITSLPGFEVEELYSVDKPQGSWVAMAFDHEGKLYVSSQYGQLYRLTLKEGKVAKIESVKSPGKAQGLCWAYGSLYMSVATGKKGGVYRLTDTNKDGSFDKQEHIIPIKAGGEHGIHSIIKSNDGGLYFVAGNFIQIPQGARSINHNNWKEDVLLKHLLDPRGHANHVRAPGGFVMHFQPDGSDRKVVGSGMRNTYDIALSPDGSLFGYDADMEWDAGTPWYRPTRLIHITPGSEFGWRTGTSKWPEYFADSLPSVLDMGPGSPTGTVFGTHAKFPKRYREALYLLDWTFGRIYAVHLTPDGASYRAEKEVFVSGKPLPVSDAAIGPDGAMYFIVGGRRLNSKLYRISYNGKWMNEPVNKTPPPLTALLNQLLDKPDGGFVWKHLDHSDRRVRYTARVALEVMGNAPWMTLYMEETSPVKVIEASIALARLEKEYELLLKKISAIDFARLDETQKLACLRALSLCLSRNQSAINSSYIERIRKQLEVQFPAPSFHLNVELARVLTKLESKSSTQHILHLMETAVNEAEDIDPNLLKGNRQYGKAFERMLANQPNAKALRFALILMSAKQGWSPASVKRYYSWLNEAELKDGGESYKGFIRNIRKEALKGLSADLQQVANKLPKPVWNAEPIPIAKGPGRAWTLQEARKETADLSKANYENGRKMFQATLCSRCHVHGNKGGVSGPNLTNLATRFNKEDILKAILDPSEVISEQYHFHMITLTDGSTVVGKVLSKGKDNTIIAPSAFDLSQTISIPTAKIQSTQVSKASPMPPALVNALSADELRDLMKFLTTE